MIEIFRLADIELRINKILSKEGFNFSLLHLEIFVQKEVI